jgi:hypothetical protein
MLERPRVLRQTSLGLELLLLACAIPVFVVGLMEELAKESLRSDNVLRFKVCEYCLVGMGYRARFMQSAY